MKLFGSTKKLIDKTKNGEKVPSVEVIEVILVQCNLADIFFWKLGFTPCKAKQPLQGMKLEEKEAQNG